MKAVTKSEIPHKMIHLFRQLKLVLAGMVVLLVLALLPEVVLELVLDKPAIRQKIRAFTEASRLAVTYDDIVISAYRGVILSNIKISHDADFSRGRVLLEAREFKIRPDYLAYFSGTLVPLKFYFSGADLRFWLEDDALSTEMLSQLRDWYTLSPHFEIRFQDSRLELFLKRGFYDKEHWVIPNTSGRFIRSAAQTTVEFTYNNLDWGSGEGRLSMADCFLKECGLEVSVLEWEFDKLKLPGINWLLPELTITGGIAEGKLSRSRKINIAEQRQNNQNNLIIAEEITTASVKARDVTLLRDETLYLDKSHFDISLKMKKNEGLQEIQMAGNYNDIPFELSWIAGNAPLPNLFELAVKNNGKSLQLPGNILLTGLNQLHISLRNEKNNYTHNASVQILNGIFQYSDKFSLNIPVLKFNSRENKFTFESEFVKNGSKLNLTLEGEAIPFLTRYRPIAYPLMTGFKGQERDIPAWKIKAQGRLNSERFFYSDVHSLVLDLRKHYEQSLIEGLHHSYAPSRIRDREFFRKYIENLNLNLGISGQEVWLSDRDNLSLSGDLKTDYSGVKINLQDTSSQNQVELQYSYLSNIPYVTGRYALFLRDGKLFLGSWIDRQLFESFAGVKINYSFNAQGERPADIYLSERGRGDWFFSNVILGEEGRRRYIVPNWDSVKFSGTRTGPLLAISRYEAENHNFILSGTATRKETNLQPQYSFTFQLKQKN